MVEEIFYISAALRVATKIFFEKDFCSKCFVAAVLLLLLLVQLKAAPLLL